MMQPITFKQSLKQLCNVNIHESILVAVSGGADSMALLHILQQCENQLFVAHFNFCLRGDESDGDEAFVRQYCHEHNLPLFVNKVDTNHYAQNNGLSIEMAARQLRYEWFEQLCAENNINHIAVGHHLDDNIETFFINLIRGTGMRGLAGIQPVNGRIIRPMLQFTQQDIIDYCKAQNIAFRTDSSNADSKFVRNKIRNQIIPIIQSINPSFSKTMHENMLIYNEIEMFVKHEMEVKKAELLVQEEETILIPISLINEIKSPLLVLHELLSDKGFSSSQIHDISLSLKGNPGKQFFTEKYRLIRDRYNLILTVRSLIDDDEHYIESESTHIAKPINLQLQIFDKPTDFQFSKDANCVHIDLQHIDFPLQIRKWQQGDQFRPLGMKNFKKLSDFFIDEKYSLIAKDNTWLLINREDIVWVIGSRLDDRYKITPNTKQILEIVYKKNT